VPLLDAVGPNPLQTAFPAVNTITLAGQTMPGLWVLKEAPKEFGWQVQKAFGLSGAFVFPIGDEIVAPKFEISIWRSADYAVFREVRKTLLKKPVFTVGGTLSSKALGIYHPELKDLGVEAVVVKLVTPMVNDGTGLWQGTVQFYQWRKPVLAPPKPSTKIPDVAPPQPTATDAQQVEIARLRAERAKLGAL
jgi:hypothetical protein